MKRDWSAYMRILWAVAVKDIGDALRSKVTLSIVLGVLITVLSGQALPWLIRLRNMPAAVIYDIGHTQWVGALRGNEAIRVYAARSQAEMETLVTERTEAVLGLVIPANADATLAAGDTLNLDGYVAHWVTAQAQRELQTLFEAEIGNVAEGEVTITLRDTRLYPAPDARGQPAMLTMSMVMATVLICVVLVPYLMIEEKETHTLDALLVSPASIAQVVLGKALAGAFYGLLAGAVALLIAQVLIVHWSTAILAVIGGTVFAVAVGLSMGSIFADAQSMGIWMGMVMLLLLIPVFAQMMETTAWPPALRAILPNMPTGLMAHLFHISFAKIAPFDKVMMHLASIVAWSLPLYAFIIWRVRQSDR